MPRQQLEPRSHNLPPKPTRSERRRIRRSPAYSEIRSRLGTTDAQTLLLLRIGDLHLAHVGQQVTRRSWSRSHVLIGLTPRLKVQRAGEISGPWMIFEPDLEVEVTVASPGSVIFIHRRHLPLVTDALGGAVEPVGRLTRAALHQPTVGEPVLVVGRSGTHPNAVRRSLA